MARILCIESGTAVCSVGLAVNGALVSLRESDSNRNHASELAMYIDEILEENDLRGDDLDAVAVGSGPGSYTGLRIGAATAKGICYSLSIPLIAVDSLKAMAMLALEEYNVGLIDLDEPDRAILMPMVDARRMEVYTAGFHIERGKLVRVEGMETEAVIVDGESFDGLLTDAGTEKRLLMFGDGAKKCFDVLAQSGRNVQFADISSSARGMVELAQEAFDKSDFADVAYWEPFYLKDFVVTASKKKLF